MGTWLDEQPEDAVERALANLGGTPDGQARIDDVNGDERFALWLQLVDARMVRLVGVGYRDIGDWTWRDAYDGGYSPRDAAREGLEADDTWQAFMGDRP